MKCLACLMTALMMVITASNVEAAQNNNDAKAKQAKKEAERKKKREERDARNKAIKDFMEGKDANKDGTLTMDEYLTGETDKEAALKKFQQHNKNGDRSLTKSEIADMLGLKDGD